MAAAGIKDANGAISTWREGLKDMAGPMRLAELAVHAMRLSEALPSADGKVSCAKGCAACCRQVVPVSPPEAFLLSDCIGAMREKDRRAVLDRFSRLADRLRLEGMDGLPLFNHAREYFSLGMPCPFLTDEACSIHVGRPLGCREHLVLSPAEACSGFPDAFIRTAPIPLSVREALAEVSAECAGNVVEMIPLARGLEWAEAHSEMRDRTWEGKWLLDRLAARCLAKLSPHWIPIAEPAGDVFY
ncbi:MAG: hypothetical protein JWP91_3206 [Fibrobacteres bacterium]|nr:hypothetical protein [Fibrobacterota bacterium]